VSVSAAAGYPDIAVAAGASPLLQVTDVSVQYDDAAIKSLLPSRRRSGAVRAADRISLTVRRGEIVALIGESGCGKTSLLQAILRMQDVCSGSIVLDGTDITTLGHRAMRPYRRLMQMIYQDPYESLDPRMRVGQTVEEPLRAHGIDGASSDRRDAVVAALERCGLQPGGSFVDRYPHELSGGQRQRVAIAASLVCGPELLLADEPVSMLDMSVRAGILSLLTSIRDGGSVGILMATHDLATASHVADRIAVMYLGEIVEQGPAAAVIADPRHPYTQALLSVVPTRGARRTAARRILAGEVPDPRNPPQGCRLHPRCPVAEAECASDHPRLARVSAPGAAEWLVACRLVGRRAGERQATLPSRPVNG
jgi:peptide/nickel transport system ATP-binding protein